MNARRKGARGPYRLCPLACLALAMGGVVPAELADEPSFRGARIQRPVDDSSGGPEAATRCPNPQNLLYHGGPVMMTASAFTIFWSPGGGLSRTFRDLNNRFFSDLGGSALYNIATQYYQDPGPAFIDNASTLGGTWVDGANPYPGGRGTNENPLTDQDVQGEIVRALAANPGWPPPDLSSAYFVFTEPGVASCADPTTCTPGVSISGPLAQFYCAYHSSFELGGRDVIYANMPFGASLPGCCGVRASPNGDASADTEICLASHEHFEMVTDPLDTGWYNGDLCEIGDKCVARYGAFQPDGHNVVLNGNPYVVQLEWSNADGDGVSRLSGCVKRYGADVDLAVSAIGSPDRVTTGDVVTYAISVKDLNEAFEGTDLDLVDLLPAGTALRSPILPAGWSCVEQPPGGTIGCTKQSLAAGVTDMLRLQAGVDCAVADGTLLTNVASITSTSSDPVQANDGATATVIARNPAPEVTCPPGTAVECTATGGTPADHPGLGAFFAQASASDNCPGVALGNDAPGLFPLGTTTVTFTAVDSGGARSSCQSAVTVRDTTPPEIRVTLDAYLLWPPDHRMVDIAADVAVSDVCDPRPGFALISITSNEPDDGQGDGSTTGDIQEADYGTPDTHFRLRAERSGGGGGRTYSIRYRAYDASGHTTDAVADVIVPHSR